jgi:hypothetical protein
VTRNIRAVGRSIFRLLPSFQGLFAPVERGVTRYSVLQSVRSLQSHLKCHSTSNSSSGFSRFTTLQTCMAYSNSALRRIRAGTVLELCRTPIICSPSPSLSISSANRFRTLFANLPNTLNKHLLTHHQSSRLLKKQSSSTDYLEVKSIPYDEHFCLKFESTGMFVPVQAQAQSSTSSRRSSFLPCTTQLSSPLSSSSSSNQIQGLYTAELLSQLTDQYPLIAELVVSRTLEDNVPTSVGYPLRRLTLHRFVDHHTRIIAFDMKNYAFIELDTDTAMDLYAVEHEDTLFQRYQAQLRWCDSHVSSFRSHLKTIVHSSYGTAMFVQATPLRGQQLQQYHQRHESLSSVASPLAKHMPQTIFTSHESISSIRWRVRTPLSCDKFPSSLNCSKADEQAETKRGQTTGPTGTARKDVRDYFNDPSIRTRLQATLLTAAAVKHTSFNPKHVAYRMNSADSDSNQGDEETEDSYQCTAL